MRKVVIKVHNNQIIEIFVDKFGDGFEFWAIGMVRGHRMVIDHHLTHDNLEARLEYAKQGDLIWRDATRSEIPAEKHKKAIAQEETIARDVFWDYEGRSEGGIQTVTCHLGAIDFLTVDRRESAVAKDIILGQWTDGVLTFSLASGNRLQWSCADRQHWLNSGEGVHGHAPDWWNYAKWRIAFMNHEHGCGTHVGVLHIGKHELHLEGGHLHRMAHIFHRIEG